MTRRMAAGLVALALATPLPAVAQSASGDLRAQIEKMDRAWEKAYNAGDATALTALYAKDAKVLAPGAEPASGAEAIRAFFAKNVTAGAKNAITLGDVVGAGDYAVETGGWVATSPEGKHLDHGPFVTVYKKEGSGWKIYRDTWNSSMAHQ